MKTELGGGKLECSHQLLPGGWDITPKAPLVPGERELHAWTATSLHSCYQWPAYCIYSQQPNTYSCGWCKHHL